MVREERTVLENISVSWSESRIGVIGANGSGKSTFARLINGLVRPTAGEVVVNGLPVQRATRDVRRQVGFVFQQPDSQIVMPLVHEDVAFGLVNRGVPAQIIEWRVHEVLERFGLAALANRPCHSLSGGEKQLLALAGALAGEPSIVVLDEPTAMLDLRNRHRFGAAVSALAQQVVMVTHDLELLADFDRVLVFHDGRLVLDAPPAQAISRYREWAGGVSEAWPDGGRG